MGLFASFVKKEAYPLRKLAEHEQASTQALLTKYKDFYLKYNHERVCLYDLIDPEQLTSPYHNNVEAEKRLSYAFPFTGPCIFEELKSLKQKDEVLAKTAYGNIPIGNEGCGIYWILVTGGPHTGEVWLLTDCGITPVGEKLTLKKWYDTIMQPGTAFWYDPLAEWGQEKDAFFLGHAAVKMADISENIFGVESPLCLTCLNLLGKIALHEDTYFIVSDPLYTYVFGSDPPGDMPGTWILTDMQNGVKFFKRPKSDESVNRAED